MLVKGVPGNCFGVTWKVIIFSFYINIVNSDIIASSCTWTRCCIWYDDDRFRTGNRQLREARHSLRYGSNTCGIQIRLRTHTTSALSSYRVYFANISGRKIILLYGALIAPFSINTWTMQSLLCMISCLHNKHISLLRIHVLNMTH